MSKPAAPGEVLELFKGGYLSTAEAITVLEGIFAGDAATPLTEATIQSILEDEVYCDRFEGNYDYGDAVKRIMALSVTRPAPEVPAATPPDLGALEYQLSEAAKIIQFMLPFLDKKATESGDVAGIQLNAKQFISQPIVVRSRTKAANQPENELLREALSKALAYCDEAIHPTDQYCDEREALYRPLEGSAVSRPAPETPASTPPTVTDAMTQAAYAIWERVYIDEDRSAEQAMKSAIEAALALSRPAPPDDRHYLSAIRKRLEQLYDASAENPRLREQISDEIDWVDAALSRPAPEADHG